MKKEKLRKNKKEIREVGLIYHQINTQYFLYYQNDMDSH